MNIRAIAFTEQGIRLGERLTRQYPHMTLARCKEGMLKNWTKEAFQNADALLFIGAAGIAVRAISPYIQKKDSDPAVVVMDELGRFAIPLLSGHIGGANELAVRLGRSIGAQPVITTATDINGVFAIDTWAKKQGLLILNPERIKWISARLLSGETIHVNSLYPIQGPVPDGVLLEDKAYDVLITHRTKGKDDVLRLIPPTVTLGIGCRKGISADAIEEAFAAMLGKASCHAEAIRGVASIDLKKNEPGILEFCARHSLPFETFSAEELSRAEGSFTASAFVESITSVNNVCERAAVLASGGKLLSSKQAGNGVTMALAIKEPALCFEED